MKRHKLITEIYEHCNIIGSNLTTLVLLLATMTDKQLTKFHKEYLEIKKH